MSDDTVFVDSGFQEIQVGALEGGSWSDYYAAFGNEYLAALTGELPGGENIRQVAERAVVAFKKVDSTYAGKRILVISHGGVLRALLGGLEGVTNEQALAMYREGKNLFNEGQIQPYTYVPVPLNAHAELDLHRPHIDEIELEKNGKSLTRVREVMDVWFDSGAMPFAQDHYPTENRAWIEGAGYPADFISEAIDQTRGWFYTLHAVGSLMGRGRAYNNVICLGHILDAEGKKMSKSIGNVVNPWEMIATYGVDALRFWMYSINQPGESKNFDEKTIDEIVKKVFNLLENSVKFYELHSNDTPVGNDSSHVLDRWIIARVHQLAQDSARELDTYDLLTPTRAIRDFVADLSQWYIRRSRDRFKSEGADHERALATTRYVLLTLSKLMAPFTPFVAEDVYGRVRSEHDAISVHLCAWPQVSEVDIDTQLELPALMGFAREAVSELLERRAKAGIKVRQPLARARIDRHLPKEYLAIIADEVNVKDVTIGDDVWLDTTITEELKLEGALREVVRAVQQLRKEAGLLPEDEISLTVSESAYVQRLLAVHGNELKRLVRARSITTHVDVRGTEIVIDSDTFAVALIE